MTLIEARHYLQLFDHAVLSLRHAQTHEEALAASSKVQQMCPTVVLAINAAINAVNEAERQVLAAMVDLVDQAEREGLIPCLGVKQ
jgi:hypothetical protein